jgi:hypothetical protein
MRRLLDGVAVAAVATLVAACGGGNESGPASSSTTTTSSKPPIAQAALANLLLTPAEVDSVLGVTGSKSKEKIDKLQDDASKNPPGPNGGKFPDECAYILGPVETQVYTGSGNTAIAGDDDTTSLNNDQDIDLGQAVVLYPSAKQASDFFTASSQKWPACADRTFSAPAAGDNPEFTWKMGPFANNNGVLTITASLTAGGPNPMTVTVQRALTVRNNVAVDVMLMRKDPADLAVKAAGQIAAKVDKG